MHKKRICLKLLADQSYYHTGNTIVSCLNRGLCSSQFSPEPQVFSHCNRLYHLTLFNMGSFFTLSSSYHLTLFHMGLLNNTHMGGGEILLAPYNSFQ